MVSEQFEFLTGIHAALLSGFSDDGALDAQRQENILEFVLRQSIKGLYVGGSTAESPLMNCDELMLQQEIVANFVTSTDHVLIAHVGLSSLTESQKLARNAEKLGYAAISALPPYSFPFSEEEIYCYYQALSETVDVPLIVYEIPMRTQRPLSLEVLSKLLELVNVAGIKFTSTDLFKYSQLRMRFPDKVFFYGFDEIYAAAAALGSEGGIGSTYNVLGNLYVKIDQAIRDQDVVGARRLQSLSQKYVEELMKVGVIPGLKATLSILGVDCGPTRLPLSMPEKAATKRLEAFLRDPSVSKWLPVSARAT